MANPKEKTDPVAKESLLLQCVSLFRAGDSEAFGNLVSLSASLIESVVASFSVPLSEKDDLYQEALIGLYKAALAYRPSLSSFSTFAYLCMRSNILSFLRKSQKSVSVDSVDDWETVFPKDAPFSDPEHALLAQEALQHLLLQIDRVLSPLENRILGLHLQGRTREEIAALCQLEVKSVDNALFRCRRKLKSALEN